MGSLTSTPTPPAPIVVQQPAPAPQPAPTSEPDPVDPRAAEESSSERRTRSLLARSRSRLGTIATGFRGLLQETSSGARKTLLGE